MLLVRTGRAACGLRNVAPLARSSKISLHACKDGACIRNACTSSASTFPLLKTNQLIYTRRCHPLVFTKRFASDLPHHVQVPLPALSPTMEKGNIKSWAKNEGDKLDEGDLLALIETDKATMDFETPQPGYLAKIVVPAGSQDVPLGKLLCIIVDNEADVAAFKNFKSDGGSSATKSGDSGSQDATSKKAKLQEESAPAKSSGNNKQAEPTIITSTDAGGGASGGGNYPDHKVIKLPALSPTVEKSTIKTWDKKEGQKIGEGDLIATVETDKATIDWTYEDTEPLYMAKILVPAGTSDVLVGQAVCVFVSKEADVKAFADFKASGDAPPKSSGKSKEDAGQHSQQQQQQKKQSGDSSQQRRSESTKPQPDTSRTPERTDDQAQQQARSDDGRVFASPYARKLAGDRGYDVSNISGSGPGGRVVAADVENFDPSKQSARPSKQQTVAAVGAAARQPQRTIRDSGEPYTDIPVTNIRGVIAKRLLESKQQIPHYYLSIDIEMDDVMRIRQRLNTDLKNEGIKLSLNDFVIKAAAHSCVRIPQCNSSWMGQAIRQFNTVDVSVAVSTDNGLITPIVFDADVKGLAQISSDIASLGKKARDGKLKPHEFQGGSFTVSNLGMFNVKNFSAIINPPQACILAVGGIEKRILPDVNEPENLAKIRVAAIMSVTLCCDHRVVDGAVGAQWLQNFKRFLESPATMLL